VILLISVHFFIPQLVIHVTIHLIFYSYGFDIVLSTALAKSKAIDRFLTVVPLNIPLILSPL
jgi:hypothetical protein